MIRTVFLAGALLCALAIPTLACDAMRPCYPNGRLLYGPQAVHQVRRADHQVRRSERQVRPRTLPPGLSRVMAEGAGRAIFGSDLISRARSYMGTNPTGWRRLWCARFMAMIAPKAAARIHNPNYARNWAGAGTRLSHCEVGAIAVIGRRGGGHVGVVTACGASGPTVVSGNHGHRVGEGFYSAGRVIAFVDPRGA